MISLLVEVVVNRLLKIPELGPKLELSVIRQLHNSCNVPYENF